MSAEEKYFYEFGRFRLDPVKRRLLRDGEPLRLTPKAFDTLLVLVRSSGRTLEKDELMQLVWPDAVVEENNLNQNISALRRALQDTRDDSRYIATIPGLGYRFVAEVNSVPFAEAAQPAKEPRILRLVVGGAAEQDEDDLAQETDRVVINSEPGAPVAPAARERDSSERSEPSSPSAPADETVIGALKRHKAAAALALGLMIILAAAIAIWIMSLSERTKPGRPENDIEITTLTRTGTNGAAAISPDGRHIVYSVREAGRESLWIRQTAASSTQQIIPPAEVEYFALTFSNEGNHVFFVRNEGNTAVRALYRMPALGGVPTKLLTDLHSPVTFSPDGSRMAFVRNSTGESALIVADVNGNNQRVLARRPMSDYFKIADWSPDGKEIACSAGSGDPYDINNSVIAVRVPDGTQRSLTPQKWAWTRWVEWLADGSGLLITGRDRHEAPNQIWHIPYPRGAARRLTSDSKPYFSISLTADSQTLLAVQSQLLSDIWVMTDGRSDRARKVTFGSGAYGSACYAPDGRIVYSSGASGTSDIWIMNADGTNQTQLTADAGINEDPVVSPNGRYIVFASNRAGAFNVWRVNSDGSDPVQLTTGSGEKFPQCSPDGEWVVYNSVASDQDFYALWKVPIQGGEPVRLTDSNTYYPAISPEGKRIAYSYRDDSSSGKYKIAVVPFEGGQPERTLEVPQELDSSPYVHWSSDGQSLTYAAANNGFHNIWLQPLAGGAPKPLTGFKDEGRIVYNSSRDGKLLVLTRRLWTNDLVLLRHFAPPRF